MFTTRPEIRGTFGVVTSTHWIASQVGMAMLERGGNAFDAAVAAGFCLQVVEPHLCGPAGEVPIIFHSAATGKIEVLCGQGPAPAAATIAAFRDLGLDAVPGSGLISAVVPGSFGAWLTLLRDHGRLRLEEVMAPAIGYAEHGHPLLPGVSRALAELKDAFTTEWPTSAPVWLPGGEAPQPHALFRNPTLASTWKRILAQAGQGAREVQIERALSAWYEGFVAEAIGRFGQAEALMDSSGHRHKALLTAQDMAGWRPAYEAPATLDYHGWTICKTRPWGQGPVLLQALSLLRGFDLASLDPNGADFAHLVLEASKLAFADREAYYGDPDFVDVPLDALLGEDYAAARRGLIGEAASHELRPGVLPGFEDQVTRALGMVRVASGDGGGLGVGEPTMAHLKPTLKPGDTVHLDVIDSWGNMVSATPSGGWPQSSPTIPELGFALNTRAQMFWLTEGLPASLAPGKRPRTTLTPTLALHDGRPALVCGTPGGDQQDQWQLALLLRRIHHGLGLQQAIDMPLFHTVHFPSSFYPREAMPGVSVAEESMGEAVIADLRRRGHDIQVAPAWSAGRLTAAERGADGVLKAAATPRLMQAYAVGR
ncbi:gamma-glutamyltransferase family protein [Phenylobacterium sp.]|uniref:gamma-glutamyltransferase family protein n=1 Tax=Phenylobacterium sp. TaxID=1871053 RepID=UPI00273149BC|nr:gamma-glutamyltransferase family protein [Phenylobacterium sp.]MDP1616353.1 gamma-glutamyltransferase family protein [Phenylobacterium sp.]MDP1988201.1 gamma-glutamyltransferase family protein [Phenylobacterium sp.]